MNPFQRFLIAGMILAMGLSLGVSGPVAAIPVLKSGEDGSFRLQVASGGRHDFILPITKWGRYSIQVAGERPVALSLSDKRNGVVQRDGEAGQKNPRIDVFLDIGEYKLAVQGLKNAEGTSILTAMPFKTPADFKSAYLLPLRENRCNLNDLEQADFWFEALSDTLIYVEAVGRNLVDLVLWRDGEWLVETNLRRFTSLPKPETPLSGLSFSIRIPKGIYRVGAYGGPGRDWAVKDQAHPLYIQLGMEKLAKNSVASWSIPPRGYAQFLLEPEVSTLVIEKADKQKLYTVVNRLGQNLESAGWLATDSISEKSAAPRMLMALPMVNAGNGWRMVTVSGLPGQNFTATGFGSSQEAFSSDRDGNWWVSSLHTGDYRDQIGASGLLLETTKGQIIAIQADTLSSQREIAKKFNLLASLNTFIWVADADKYMVAPGGVGFNWRINRVLIPPPPNQTLSEYAKGAKTLDLNQGLYLLEINPDQKGIATLALKKASLIGDIAGGLIAAGKAAIGVEDKRVWTKPNPSVQFTHLAVSAQTSYAILLNSQEPELSTSSFRALPINPDQPLGFWIKPGEKLGIPIKTEGRRLVRLTDPAGKPAAFETDGKRFEQAVELEAGSRNLSVTGGGLEPRFLLLQSLKPELNPTGPLPAFPDVARQAIPKFPVVAPESAVYFDLDRNTSRPHAVRVTQSGLYRIETNGRLATQLTLSDRFRHFTREAGSNGVGRNALLIEYLLPGEYQLTASTTGQSAGHLGLAVFQNKLVDGGALEADIDNRKFVEAFSGADFSIHLASPGRFRLESLGQNGNFPLRLEDQDGWPFDPAVSNDGLDLNLDSGDYRLISLPTAQAGRRITRLVPVVEQRAIKGKGPHPLALNTTLASTWVEGSGKDSLNAPAVFTLEVAAPIQAQLTVTLGFQGKIYRVGQDSVLAQWSGTKKHSLAMGSYRIAVRPEKKKNFAPYQISVKTKELIPGLSIELHRAQTTAISLGTASIVELGSQGMLDVSATLLAEDAKTVVAANDDGYLDWNFSISRALKAGRYFLRTESAEPNFSSTSVFMRALTDTLLDTLAAPPGKTVSIPCRLNRRLGVFPLASGNGGDLIACTVQGRSRIGCALEKQPAGSGEWISIAQTGGMNPSLCVPGTQTDRYRLKVWSETNVDETITVNYGFPSAQLVDWKTAQSGLSGQPVALGTAYRAWYKIDLGNQAPGHFRAVSDQNPLGAIGVSGVLDSALNSESPDWFASSRPYAWMEFRFEQPGRFKVKLQPLLLDPHQPLTMPLKAGSPRIFATGLAKGALGFLSVESEGGVPLAGVLGKTEDAVAAGSLLKVMGIPVKPVFWMGPSRTATVTLPEDAARVVLWNALPVQEGAIPDAKITWSELPLVPAGTLTPGTAHWNAENPSARMFELPKANPVRIRVTLPPSSAILVQGETGIGRLEVAMDESLVKEFTVKGGRAYLLALKGRCDFELTSFAIPTSDQAFVLAAQSLSPQGGWEQKLSRPGTEFLPLSGLPGQGLNLFYRGAVATVDWIGGNGLVHANLPSGFSVGPGGLMKITHAAGWVKMDLGDAKSAADVMACKWGNSLTPSGATEITQASALKLQDQVNWFSFSLAEPQHVNFNVPQPLSAILLCDGKALNYQEAWDSFNWDLPLPAGRYALGLRNLAGSSLAGGTLATLFRPIGVLSEKRPFQGYLAPGESRLLAFEIPKRDKYGLGLRMANETVQARILTGSGVVVEQGKQQFLTLISGKYYLWLRVPEDAEGTELTVNLFGQEMPPNDPPEKLVQWIINGASGPRHEALNNDAAEPVTRRPEWERFIRSDYDGDGSGNRYQDQDQEQEQVQEQGEGDGEGGDGNEGDGSENGDAQDGSQEGDGEGE